MSSLGMLIRNTFINKNAPLNNGVGRFIPQLARITLKVNIYLISSTLRNCTSVRSILVLTSYVGTIGLAFLIETEVKIPYQTF